MPAPRIAFWPRSTRNSVASYRIRCARIRDELARRGISAALYDGREDGRGAPDLLILSKRSDPASLDRALALRERHGTRILLDLSDNVYFGAETAEGAARAGFEALTAALRRLDAVVTPSDFLRDAIAARVGAGPRFVVIADAVEPVPEADLATRLWNARAFHALGRLRRAVAAGGAGQGRRLIWFGISGTKKARNGLYDLETLTPNLARHHAEAPLSLSILSDNRRKYTELFAAAPFPTFYADWSYWTFDACFAGHDIALLPARRNDYNWAKSANRLTTAFARGVAVAATGIPSYGAFADCAVLDDWDGGLAELMRDHPGRAARIRVGAERAWASYGPEPIARRWEELFADLLGRPLTKD